MGSQVRAVVGFIWVRVGSLGGAKEASCSFVFIWVHSGAPSGGQDQLGSLGFTQARLGVVWFILIRLGSFIRT